MRRTFAVLAAVVLGLLASAGQASASDPPGSAEDAQTQAAAGAESALALAGGLQGQTSAQPSAQPSAEPSAATAASPPADTGSVDQSNTGIAGSLAANGNATGQTTSQTQSGGSGTQAAGQIAGNQQSAASSADAHQSGATNQNVDVRIFSPGDSGSVTQSNTVIAGSLAANANKTTQDASQTQGGPGSGSTQASGQAAASKQDASSAATAAQHGAKNSNISVRILSPGDDGDVSQSNTVAGIAAALNGNKTDQTSEQSQARLPTGSGTQAALQGAVSGQQATSSADASQHGASNQNISIRVLSPGDNGSVHQSNKVLAGSLGLNANKTSQTADQAQGGRYGGSNQQVVGQAAKNHQDADAYANAEQYGASNANVPVRVLSEGDDGDVSQSNTVAGLAAGVNLNKTDQSASQSQGGGAPMSALEPYSDYAKLAPPQNKGTGVQAVGQLADNTQYADAASSASQERVSNLNAPVRIGSKGDSGSTTQANTVLAGSLALNANKTDQDATQSQSGSGTLVQAVGQAAKSKQDADAWADAEQKGAKNTNAPVRVFGHGDTGSTSQSNAAAALAGALNGNKTDQSAAQSQSGGPWSTLVQGSGQAAEGKQAATGNAGARQHGVSNESSPVAIGGELRKPCESPKRPCESKPKVSPPGYPCDAAKHDGRTCERPVEPPPCIPCKRVVKPCDPCERPKPPCKPRRYRLMK